jgi:hypothetical protein
MKYNALKALIQFLCLIFLIISVSSSVILADDTVQSLSYPAPAFFENGKRWNETDDKIEVLSLFMYHCPACRMISINSDEYSKALPQYVRAESLPVAWSWKQGGLQKDITLAIFFFTIKEMNLEEKLHLRIFRHYQDKKRFRISGNLASPASQKNYLKTQLKEFTDDQYDKALESVFKNKTLEKLFAFLDFFNVDTVPSVIVNGRYVIIFNPESGVDAFFAEISRVVELERNRLNINK